MMNAELVKHGQTKIIIPTVYRDDYMLALRLLTRQQDPSAYVKMMMRAHEFSSTIIGDDMDAKDMLSFPQLANAKPDETIVFSWVVFESREARDAANAKIFEDPRMTEMMDASNQIFDSKRMAYGGFNELVHG